jgi:hypothetical protein
MIGASATSRDEEKAIDPVNTGAGNGVRIVPSAIPGGYEFTNHLLGHRDARHPRPHDHVHSALDHVPSDV